MNLQVTLFCQLLFPRARMNFELQTKISTRETKYLNPAGAIASGFKIILYDMTRYGLIFDIQLS